MGPRMQTSRFNVRRASKDRLAAVLRDLQHEGIVDTWSFSAQPMDMDHVAVDFGPKTNLTQAVLQVNSRILLPA